MYDEPSETRNYDAVVFQKEILYVMINLEHYVQR